jgi:hypothetical protein
MNKLFVLVSMIAAFLTPLALEAAPPIFKCTQNGSVTYQNNPCPTGEPRRAPTAEQLNAERQKKLQTSAGNPSNSAASAAKSQFPFNPGGVAGSQALSDKDRSSSLAAPVVTNPGAYRCDGRIHCSQMTSCSEAKYFLNNCPNVKMDGDRDGIPCEEQWCQ